MLASVPDLDAVAICTPPQPRHAIARDALAAGKHVLLEKPPAATLSELVDLKTAAEAAGKTLFTTWHAQYNAGVEAARERLAGRSVTRLAVTWKEDVRVWHPGQEWIWQAGGFGVFDPGINALSIVTRILPEPVFVKRADLSFPANRDAPIAADLAFGSARARPRATPISPPPSIGARPASRAGTSRSRPRTGCAFSSRRAAAALSSTARSSSTAAGRIPAHLRALRGARPRRPVRGRRGAVPARRRRLHDRAADRRRAVRVLR
jgi:hypothetical protein